MDTLLIAITALSLLIVLVLSVVVARLLLDERRRSEARVAALAALSAEPDGEHRPEPLRAAPEPVRTVREPVVPAPERRPRPAVPAHAPRGAHRSGIPPAPPRAIEDFEFRPSGAGGAASAPLFVQPDPSSTWKPRLVIVAPLALMLLAAGIAFYPTQGEIGAPERVPAAAATREAPAQTTAPLELLSLKHAHAQDNLTVTGLVQNPKTGAPLSKVFATAFAFAADGTFLASGRAPLDFTTLAPGDESPFVVTVPVKGEVARYRVGFRSADGRVVAHVDRRGGGAIARVNE